MWRATTKTESNVARLLTGWRAGLAISRSRIHIPAAVLSSATLGNLYRHSVLIALCASEAAAQCIVIGPVCGFVCVCVCVGLFVCLWVCSCVSWRWSLPLPTDPVWWGSMHAISSYHGNRPTHPHRHTNKQTNPHTGPITIHCTAASPACSVINGPVYLEITSS